MRLSEIERIAKAAMDACSEVINHPNDGFVRERLFDSLTEVVGPAFLETDQSRRSSFNELLQQANVWSAIVRERIDHVRLAGPGDTAAPSIRHPTRELQPTRWERCRQLRRAPASVGNRNARRPMVIGTFHIAKGKAKAGKAGEVIDVAARYFVYKLYEATDGQPAQWRALHRMGESAATISRAVERGWVVREDARGKPLDRRAALTDEGRRLARVGR
jgi:hypothetical protein